MLNKWTHGVPLYSNNLKQTEAGKRFCAQTPPDNMSETEQNGDTQHNREKPTKPKSKSKSTKK